MGPYDRSTPNPAARARCGRCALPLASCLCHLVTAVDNANPNLVYTEYIGLSIMRRTDGGRDPSSYASDYLCVPEAGSPELEGGCRSGTGESNFIAPFVLDPNDNGRMLAGGNSLWVSNNIRAASPTWQAIKPPSGQSFNGVANANYISAIAVAPGNSAVIWVGHNNGSIYRTTNGTSATPTWTLVSGSLPGRWVGRILIDADNPDYHRWTDTVDKLSFTKMARISRYMFNTAWLIANAPKRPPAPQ